METYYRATDS